jgi:hypothetical protein
MAKVFIEETTLTAIGDAIRSKTGKTELIDPANMDTEIASIEAGGGGGGDLPEEAFVINGSALYKFSYDSWNWFLNDYGTRITTKDISNISFMCGNSKQLTSLPFVINVKNLSTADSAFNYCQELSTCPKIRGTFSKTASFGSLLSYCFKLRDVEDLFLAEDFDLFTTIKWTSAYSGPRPPSFASMYSLRRVPSWWYKFRVDESSTTAPSTSYTSYYQAFYGCYSLDEVTNMPVITAGTLTSNCFSNTFTNCQRLKRFTFETNEDGSPKVAQWKSQTIEFNSAGVTMTSSYVLDYNSGITEATKVVDDETYQALKNDPDWWTPWNKYSRYNHDSAVETINSLPDTSAYLASAGGTNTIKFKGANGSDTDGGAINTLTAEEIAVAAAKGWTVTIS